jgi:glycosyltransferase involved in cell wall biosynthesis
MEVFHKIRSLHAQGVNIHLHCFEYGRGEKKELERYCASVHYYRRNTGHKGFSVDLPYIVSSRSNPELLENLMRDDHPILLEGIHCSYFLHTGQLEGRKVVLRLHNVEHEYYRQQASQTHHPLRKLYFWNESRLLRKYEKGIAAKCLILAMSEKDALHYRREFKVANVAYLPPFIGWDHPLCLEGAGTFCLYHGNLGVDENARVASWLLEDVFNDVEIPFVVAGKNPSARLEKLAHRRNHTCIVSNPTEKEMQDLIQRAQVNILPSFTNTGLKFKILNSVFCGRHCVVNEQMTEGTYLEPACHIANGADAFKSILVQLFRKPFDDSEIRIRQNLMDQYYNNEETAARLIAWVS